MQKKQYFIALAALFLCSLFVSCSTKNDAVDYSKTTSWLSLPASSEKEVDIFYVYPSSYQKSSDSDPNICELNNPSMVQNAQTAFARQATAYKTSGNIYAPYYRQVDASYCLSLPLDEQQNMIKGTPTTDVAAAFEYYINHYNNGRPFILAGHSQGSNVLLYLLSDYMKENPDIYQRMVAAYIIGYSVTDEYLSQNPHLKFAEGPNDTGVIISYNTEAPGVQEGNPVLLPNAQVINPISWTKDETLASAEENAGSIPISANGDIAVDNEGNYEPVKDYADAQINKERGVLVCSTVDESVLSPGNDVFGKGVYHIYDYPFYYFNLRENAEIRTQEFLSKR